MTDFVQHQLALNRAWQDTEFIPLDEITEPKSDINHSPLDDLYSDIVRFCTLVYFWLLLYLIFSR